MNELLLDDFYLFFHCFYIGEIIWEDLLADIDSFRNWSLEINGKKHLSSFWTQTKTDTRCEIDSLFLIRLIWSEKFV